jgi:hypothetical protein
MYTRDHTREDIPTLQKQLLRKGLPEEEVVEMVRSLLSAAFNGKPAKDGRPFKSLDKTQQSVLKTIAKLDSSYYCSVEGLDASLASYGFKEFEENQLQKYIKGRDWDDLGNGSS